MIKKTTKFLLSAAVVALVGGCAALPSPEGKPLPELTFEHFSPVTLKTAAITIENNYDPTMADNNRGGAFPTPPDVALKRFLTKRFERTTIPAAGEFLFSIEDANLTSRIIESPKPAFRLINVDQQEEYTVRYKLALEQKTTSGYSVMRSVMQFEKSRTFPRSLSLAELEEAYLLFIETAIQELDIAIVKSLESNFKLIENRTLPGTAKVAPVKQEETFFESLNRDLRKAVENEEVELPKDVQMERSNQPPLSLDKYRAPSE